MIEGLKIEITSDELIEHLAERATWHQNKREFYAQQAQALVDGGIRENPGVSNDPTASLQNSAKQHGEREAFFRFLSEHVVLNETYRLSEQDLTRLEIVSRYL